MIKYVSTRGGASGTFTDTILEGLASDGGLLVPEKYEVISEERLANLAALIIPRIGLRSNFLFRNRFNKR